MARHGGWALALIVASASVQAAHPELEAEQVNVDASILAVGGSAEQQLAQVFTLSRAGYVSHVMLPLSCQPKADVRVSIEKTTAGVPDGSVVAYEELPGSLFTAHETPAVGMRMVEFSRAPLLGPGEYALVLRTKGKYDCGLWPGPTGSTYAGGKAYFIARPNPPLWIELFDASGVRDLAFQVYLRPL